jgi:hypothetical protein
VRLAVRSAVPALLALLATVCHAGTSTGTVGIELRVRVVTSNSSGGLPATTPGPQPDIGCASSISGAGPGTTLSLRCTEPVLVQLSGLRSGGADLSLGAWQLAADQGLPACRASAMGSRLVCLVNQAGNGQRAAGDGVALQTPGIGLAELEAAGFDGSGALAPVQLQRRDALGVVTATPVIETGTNQVALLVTF